MTVAYTTTRGLAGCCNLLPLGITVHDSYRCGVRIGNDDGRFEVQLTRAGTGYDHRFFRIRLRLGDLSVGDFEPAIVWQDLKGLGSLREAVDARLDPERASPEAIVGVLKADPTLHDRHLSGLGESFDHWVSFSYRWQDQAVFVIEPADDSTKPTTFSMPFDEFAEVVDAARSRYGRAADSGDPGDC